MSDQTEQMQKVTQGLMQACEEINSACVKSMDTMMESTSAATKGFEEISRKWGNLMQESVTRAMSTGKTMLAAKSMQEVATLQASFVQELMQSWMTGSSHLSEITSRTTHEAIQPVAAHANEAISTTMSKVSDTVGSMQSTVQNSISSAAKSARG